MLGEEVVSQAVLGIVAPGDGRGHVRAARVQVPGQDFLGQRVVEPVGRGRTGWSPSRKSGRPRASPLANDRSASSLPCRLTLESLLECRLSCERWRSLAPSYARRSPSSSASGAASSLRGEPSLASGLLRLVALLPQVNIGDPIAGLESNETTPPLRLRGAGSWIGRPGLDRRRPQRFLPKTIDAGNSSTGAVPLLS